MSPPEGVAGGAETFSRERRECKFIVLVLLLVIVIETSPQQIDHEQEHERDYEGSQPRRLSFPLRPLYSEPLRP